ncbi:MAG: glutamate synthase (NADPH/NADH) small chain [Halioglobus sp.]|jgi:glutamate synthase (NADPH/NADH) small chain
MGDIKGFMKYKRGLPTTEDPKARVEHFNEFYVPLPIAHKEEQAARCMDCGIPFCHSGCPLGNLIPDFNDSIYRGDWKEAYGILSQTNNFPEFTGRICPAPCESACVLGINENPVSIEYIEKSIIERAYKEGWVNPNQSTKSTEKKVAIIGSGPAGLACADQLNKVGHEVTVYERADRIGGLLRYGIPDFKLEKPNIDRRLDIMRASGIKFITNTDVGVDISVVYLQSEYDATVLCGGSTIARGMSLENRDAKGIHLAMEFLTQNNKRVAGDQFSAEETISVKDQNVVVIGGGDTGSDCIGTSNRLGARSITQLEIMPTPGKERTDKDPWPNWPMTLRTSSSHKEGCDREWSVMTKRFIKDESGNLSGLEVAKVEWAADESGKYGMKEIEGSVEIIPCQKAFLAIGFLHPQKEGLLSQLGVELDQRGNVMATDYKTSVDGVFAAGDMRRGQSLVVWAISEGREAAVAVDRELADGVSILEKKDGSVLEM